MLIVTNLSTGEQRGYMGINRREAVIAAFAQGRGDWNTWNYSRYEKEVRRGKFSISCGDWSILNLVAAKGRE